MLLLAFSTHFQLFERQLELCVVSFLPTLRQSAARAKSEEPEEGKDAKALEQEQILALMAPRPLKALSKAVYFAYFGAAK